MLTWKDDERFVLGETTFRALQPGEWTIAEDVEDPVGEFLIPSRVRSSSDTLP